MKRMILPVALVAIAIPSFMYYENDIKIEEPHLIQAEIQNNSTNSKREEKELSEAQIIANDVFGTYAIYNNGNGTNVSVLGAGFLIEYQGKNILVTNQHVVSDLLQKYYIRDYDKNKYEAKIIYQNDETDIAFLKIDTDKQLTTLKYESQTSLDYLGTKVYTIGHPYDLLYSISSGIISNFKNNVVFENEQFKGMLIQTDMNVNPGNSGGPLLNKQGAVLGVVSSSLKGATGISFAVPMETVLKELEKVDMNY